MQRHFALFNIPDADITCIEARKSQVYVGTKLGICKYRIERPSKSGIPPEATSPSTTIPAETSNVSGTSFGQPDGTATPPISDDFVSTLEHVLTLRKPVDALALDRNILFCQSGGKFQCYSTTDLTLLWELKEVEGLSCFALSLLSHSEGPSPWSFFEASTGHFHWTAPFIRSSIPSSQPGAIVAELPAASPPVPPSEARRICVAHKRQLLVYQASAAGAQRDGEPLTMPSRVEIIALAWPTIICGYLRQYSILNARNGKVLLILHHNSESPRILPFLADPVKGPQVALTNGASVMIFSGLSGDQRPHREDFPVLSMPLCLGYRHPYLIIVEPREVEIWNYFFSQVGQSLKLPGVISCSTCYGKSDRMLLATKSAVHLLEMKELSLQATELIDSGKSEDVLNLVDFYGSANVRQQSDHVEAVLLAAAVSALTHGDLAGAIKYFSATAADPREILLFFPELLYPSFPTFTPRLFNASKHSTYWLPPYPSTEVVVHPPGDGVLPTMGESISRSSAPATAAADVPPALLRGAGTCVWTNYLPAATAEGRNKNFRSGDSAFSQERPHDALPDFKESVAGSIVSDDSYSVVHAESVPARASSGIAKAVGASTSSTPSSSLGFFGNQSVHTPILAPFPSRPFYASSSFGNDSRVLSTGLPETSRGSYMSMARSATTLEGVDFGNFPEVDEREVAEPCGLPAVHLELLRFLFSRRRADPNPDDPVDIAVDYAILLLCLRCGLTGDCDILTSSHNALPLPDTPAYLLSCGYPRAAASLLAYRRKPTEAADVLRASHRPDGSAPPGSRLWCQKANKTALMASLGIIPPKVFLEAYTMRSFLSTGSPVTEGRQSFNDAAFPGFTVESGSGAFGADSTPRLFESEPSLSLPTGKNRPHIDHLARGTVVYDDDELSEPAYSPTSAIAAVDAVKIKADLQPLFRAVEQSDAVPCLRVVEDKLCQLSTSLPYSDELAALRCAISDAELAGVTSGDDYQELVARADELRLRTAEALGRSVASLMSVVDTAGNNALHQAALRGEIGLSSAIAMIECGADAFAVNKSDEIPSDLCDDDATAGMIIAAGEISGVMSYAAAVEAELMSLALVTSSS